MQTMGGAQGERPKPVPARSLALGGHEPIEWSGVLSLVAVVVAENHDDMSVERASA